MKDTSGIEARECEDCTESEYYEESDLSYLLSKEENEEEMLKMFHIYNRYLRSEKYEYKIIQNVQKLSDITCYSYKKLSPQKENTLVFVCSAVAPVKEKTPSKSSNQSSTDHSLKLVRPKKRENTEPCSMRLKFTFDEVTGTYNLAYGSNINHNHQPSEEGDRNVHIKNFFNFL